MLPIHGAHFWNSTPTVLFTKNSKKKMIFRLKNRKKVTFFAFSSKLGFWTKIWGCSPFSYTIRSIESRIFWGAKIFRGGAAEHWKTNFLLMKKKVSWGEVFFTVLLFRQSFSWERGTLKPPLYTGLVWSQTYFISTSVGLECVLFFIENVVPTKLGRC
jgi:hypothetical protein